MNKPLVGIIMGSDSDLSAMQEAAKVLEEFGVAFEITVFEGEIDFPHEFFLVKQLE